MNRAQDASPWNSDRTKVPVRHLLSLVCARQWGNLLPKHALCAHSGARRSREPFLWPPLTSLKASRESLTRPPGEGRGLWERQCLLSGKDSGASLM